MKDHTSAAPAHLSERAAEMLGASDDERIAFIHAPRWIPYPRANRILALMEDLLVRPRSDRMPNLLIIGETNNGKTALLKRFCKAHPCVENAQGDGNDMPVVYIRAPHLPDEGRMYNRILSALVVPFRTNDRVDEKEKMVIRMGGRLRVRMLIIDEIHHIISGQLAKQSQFRNLIKNLGNEMQITIVAAGTKDAFNALQPDQQLANRFPPALLPLWEPGNEWDRLVLSFERRLPLREPSRLVTTANDKLLQMTEGAIGELSELLNIAAVAAIRSGQERIDRKLLDRLGWVPPSLRKHGGGDRAAGNDEET